jgi:uncharacterized HhH-GPD family protein
MQGTLAVTGNAEADDLLNTEPLAALIGMLLDQQVPMEWAFLAPSLLKERLGGRLDAAEIASYDPDAMFVIFKGPRALHRFPGSMAKRTQAMCAHIVEHYGGDAARIWEGVDTGAELFRRIRELPGYGEEKARIFTAVLAKRLGVAPKGWEEQAGPFADDEPRSVADIDSPESFAKVRAWKQAKRKAGKSKQD